jgi:hypothetical protein
VCFMLARWLFMVRTPSSLVSERDKEGEREREKERVSEKEGERKREM